MSNDRVLPIPSRASKSAVANYAERQAKLVSFEPGDDLYRIVKRLGGSIKYISILDEQKDSIEVRSKRDFTVLLSSTTSPVRDRFTVAHELGHYALHYPVVLKHHGPVIMYATRWVDESDDDLVRAEWEANWFAASFLMPEGVFREKWNEGIGAVADFFAVSESAAAVRAKSLGLQ